MEEKKSDNGTVITLLLVLAFAVILVDDVAIRVAIALLPALLLAQRAMDAGGGSNLNPSFTGPDRRRDPDTRASVDELLGHVREFYLTVHMAGAGTIDSEEMLARTSKVERKLNQLLARLCEVQQRPQPQAAEAPGGVPAGSS
jgi:hypothetical protein